MQVNSINLTNFSGKVVRRNLLQNGSLNDKKEMSKKDVDKTYETAIKDIQEQHKHAVELDEFMNSKEVKKEVAKLPENVNIQICNLYNDRYIDKPHPSNGHKVAIQDVSAIYDNEFNHNREIENRKVSSMSCIRVQKEDGTINKKLIMKWIKSLQEYFNDDKPMDKFLSKSSNK